MRGPLSLLRSYGETIVLKRNARLDETHVEARAKSLPETGWTGLG